MKIFIQQNQVARLAGFAGLTRDLIIYTPNTVAAIAEKMSMTRNASIQLKRVSGIPSLNS